MAVRTFLPYTKKVRKPQILEYSLFPKTVGEHIRKVRIERGLSQREVGTQIGVSEESVYYWENGRSVPQVQFYPRLIAFLGYYPFEHEMNNIAGKLKQVRYCNGWTCSHFATVLGVDVATVTRWEHRKSVIPQKMHSKIMQLWLQLPEHTKLQYLSK